MHRCFDVELGIYRDNQIVVRETMCFLLVCVECNIPLMCQCIPVHMYKKRIRRRRLNACIHYKRCIICTFLALRAVIACP